MKYYVKYDKKSGLCSEVGTGTNAEFYKSIGMILKDVEQSDVDGQWYLTEKCPHKSDDEKLQDAKNAKLAEVENQSNAFNENLCKEMIITSSLGGRFDADLRSQTNIQGLIELALDDNLYRDADNNFIKLSNAQLKLLKGEMVQNGLSLYQQKWTLQAKIQGAKSLEELEAIEVVFVMADFSKKGDA